MQTPATIIKHCAKSINLLVKRAHILRMDFNSPRGSLYQLPLGNAENPAPDDAVAAAFYRSLSLIPYYAGMTDEKVLLRDMLLQIGSDLHFFPFADSTPGAVCFASLTNEPEETMEVAGLLSGLFSTTFGVPLTIMAVEAPAAKETLDIRLKEASKYYEETHGQWIEKFIHELGDELSRISFLTYLRQRILAKVFADSDICYPVAPPAASALWRKERKAMAYSFPILHDIHGERLDERHFTFVYTYLQYAVPGIVEPETGETIVDAGAFVGDTAAWFAERAGPTGKVFSFEPSPANAAQGENNMAANHIHNVEFVARGLAEEPGEMALVSNSSSSSANRIVTAGEGEEAIKMVSLDSLRHKLGRVDFIKADIEGSEMAMLAGARHIIKEDAPVCAICVYHKRDDFWEIPQFLKSLRPDYKFWFRCEAEPVLFAKCESPDA